MSSNQNKSFLWVNDLSLEDTHSLFQRAASIKNQISQGSCEQTLLGRQVVLFFMEASTRTKLSFQMAAQRLGAQCLVVDDLAQSSMSKGESFADTLGTIQAMGPDAVVVRCGDEADLPAAVQNGGAPIINAGFGSLGHPTQALLDAFTLVEHFGSLNGLKVLFAGDIDHSRVAHSGITLLQKLGADVNVFAPDSFYQKPITGVTNFSSLTEALDWSDVYCGLRVQFERHGANQSVEDTRAQFIAQYQLGESGLDQLKKSALVMHPGPVNWGVEFAQAVRDDSRFVMWKQKQNGVFVRAALLEKILEVKQ